MEFTVAQLAQMLGGDVEGDASRKINRLAKIEEGTEGAISFLSNLKYEQFLYTTAASAVIVDRDFEPKKGVAPTLIRVENAYTSFTRILEEYEKLLAFRKVGIEQPSFVGENTTVGEGIYRGAFSYIGSNVRIGQNVKIHPQAYVGDNVTIGDHTILYAGVKIHDNCVVGSHCTLHANVVIGADGFGFAPQDDGTYRAIPQLGNVVLEDYVSVGANTTIDCATLGSTLIRRGVKLDNLIQIGHNVEIGKNTVIAAQTGVSGSTKIGENCVIGGQVGIGGHLIIPHRTTITGRSGVTKSFRREGLVLGGFPATDNTEHLRTQASARRLPQVEKRLQNVEKAVNALSLPANGHETLS
jgi:UDP-3-O-[3-hydroxymyristoyl] glucosamine N-acyltransferase